MTNQSPEDPEFLSPTDEWDSIPNLSTSNSILTVVTPQQQLEDYKETIQIYEGVLRAIASITKVESSMDQSAEAFFFVASKMRNLAIAALQKTGAM